MSKRPLCQLAVFMVVLLVLLQQILPGVFRQDKIPAEDGETVTIRGRIYDRQEKNNKTYFYLEDVIFIESSNLSQTSDADETTFKASDTASNNSGADAPSKFQGKCIVYCSGKEGYAMGNTIQLTGILSLFEKATNPGQFDGQAYYKGLGIDFAIFQPDILSTDNQINTIKETLYAIGFWIHNKLEALAGQHASILQAMLLGEKSQMNSEIKELYQRSGISHILVISGLHFSLLGMTLYKLLRKVGASLGLAGIASVVVLFLYGVMTGFGVSAIRAFIMFAIWVGADICGRSYDLPTSLGVAVIVLVISNPYVLYQTGFLLSFGAILGIIILIPVVERLYPAQVLYRKKEEPLPKLQDKEVSRSNMIRWLLDKTRIWGRGCFIKILNSIISGIRSGAAIQLMTFPILLYSFCEFSPYSILLNCLILPLVQIVILGAIVAVFVSILFQGLSQVIIMPSLWILELYELLCRMVEKLPGASIVTGQPSLWRIVVYYVVLLGLTAGVWYWNTRSTDKESQWFKGNSARIVKMSVTAIALFLLVFLTFSRKKEGMEISMLDVGQGQSIYIRCGSEDVLYDGGSTDVSNVGRYRIVPFLKSKGVDSLELVIVSHMDADHYNGIMEILEDELMEIQCLMLPLLDEPDEAYMELLKLAEEKGVTVQQVEKNHSFTVGDTRFLVLHPYSGYDAASTNDTSVVISIEYCDFSMLFTGDVEEGGEENMIESGVLQDVDVLQVAHHGSKSSSTQRFIDAVSPEMAWISCGEDNSYGHPSQDIIERLEEAGCEYYVTMETGCITLQLE